MTKNTYKQNRPYLAIILSLNKQCNTLITTLHNDGNYTLNCQYCTLERLYI